MSSKPQVLFLDELKLDLPELHQFESRFEIVNYKLTTRDQFINDLQGDLKNIVGIYGAWLGFLPIGGIRTVIEHLPSSLKVVSFCSVGFDHADAQVLAKRGIIMTNVPADGASGPVSDLVLFLTITSFRQFQMYSRISQTPHTINLRTQLANGEFDQHHGKVGLLKNEQDYHFGQFINHRPNLSPRNHEVVIIGFGKIGQSIGKKLFNIGMNVSYITRNRLENEQALKYPVKYFKDLSEIPFDIDLIVIACPATPQTQHMINESVISNMNKPFRIINIGRGSIIDEKALIKGLQSGKILFAGLDVFENEPEINPLLLNRDDVILTPHIGASTTDNFGYTAIQAMKNIQHVIEHGDAINQVN